MGVKLEGEEIFPVELTEAPWSMAKEKRRTTIWIYMVFQVLDLVLGMAKDENDSGQSSGCNQHIYALGIITDRRQRVWT